MVTLTAHQPNFIPYAGFFDKMRKADVFVLLNWVQYEKGGYQSRFKHEGKWHTMSVNRGLDPIATKQYINHKEDWNRITTKIPKLKVFDDCILKSLSSTNAEIIVRSCELLNIKTVITVDEPTHLKGTERLVDICLRHRANKYISGPSGRKYLDLKQFENHGIEVEFFEPTDTRSLVELL